MKFIVIAVFTFLIFRQLIPLFQLIREFPLNDFSVYMSGVEHTLTDNPYTLKFFDYYNYPPAATLFFYPFNRLPVNTSEFIFTAVSVLSLFSVVILLFKLTRLRFPLYLLLITYYLFLRFSPTRLTLTLGQINLVVLLLLVLAYYLYRQGRGVMTGISLALAFIFKFTPAFLLLFFILKKQWKVVTAFICTLVLLHLLAIAAFGWPLTQYYYTQVLPQLLSQTSFYTLQRTHMNQSFTALLGRLGIFDAWHLVIKSTILLPLIFLLSKRILKSKELFTDYCLLITAMTIFLPTFAWQHHYVFLIPAIFILALHSLPLVAIFYLLLTFTIGPAFPAYPNPFIHSHLFLSAAAMFALMFVAKPQSSPGRKLIRRKPAG